MIFRRSTVAFLLVAGAVMASARHAGGAVGAEPAGAEPNRPAPSIVEMLAAIGQSAGAEAELLLPAADVPDPADGFEPVLIEIDSLLGKREYAAARMRAERGMTDKGLAAVADVLASAEKVAKALEARNSAMRRALEPHKGMPVTLWTATGRRKGDLESVSDDGAVVATKKVINGQVRGLTRYTVAWADLTPAEQAKYSKAWAPGEPVGTVARAVLALSRGGDAAAEKPLGLTAADPYAKHVLARIAARRRAASEGAAARAWAAIARLTSSESLRESNAEKATALLDAFGKDHASTGVFGKRADEIAKLRTRLQLATAPDFPTNYALAANGGTASGCSRPEELIDGNVTEYTGSLGFAMTTWAADPPPSMVVTLAKATPINFVHFRLWDRGGRFYRYRAAVSPDDAGDRWAPIADYTSEDEERRSWQTIPVPLQMVRRIRVTGTYNSANGGFHVVEIEAYHAPKGFTVEQVRPALDKAHPERRGGE